MTVDQVGLPLTTSSGAALGSYLQAVDALLAGRTDVESHATRAVQEDEGMAMAWLVLGLQRRMVGRVPEATELIQRVIERSSGVSEREAGVLRFFDLFVGQDIPAAERVAVEHLRRYPRDHLVVMYVHFLYNLMLRSVDRRERHHALARELAPSWGDDWYLLASLAFVETEAGNHGRARDLAERSLAVRPECGGAAHAMAHALLETGAIAEGIA